MLGMRSDAGTLPRTEQPAAQHPASPRSSGSSSPRASKPASRPASPEHPSPAHKGAATSAGAPALATRLRQRLRYLCLPLDQLELVASRVLNKGNHRLAALGRPRLTSHAAACARSVWGRVVGRQAGGLVCWSGLWMVVGWEDKRLMEC